jgi:hypothetical protein
MEATYTLVEVGGAAMTAPIPADFVEIDDDGSGMTVFFHGGRPACHAVTGVQVERRDPARPTAVIDYGLRLGVFGCTADLWNLAIRVPLEPPFQP